MNTITFDIETGPATEAELKAIYEPPDEAEIKTGNIKDPEKIAAKIAEARTEHWLEFTETAALSAMTGQLLAIGFKSNKVGIVTIILGETERAMLDGFWQLWNENQTTQFIGFNIFLFDLPFMIRRSWALGVDVPGDLRTQNRYWNNRFVDCRDYWQLGDRQARGSLARIGRFLGLPHTKNGSGKDFAALLATDREKALEYLRNDVLLTEALHERLCPYY